MGGQHRGRVYQRQAHGLGAGPIGFRNPLRGQAEGRILARDALDVRQVAARIQRQQPVDHGDAAPELQAAQQHPIGAGLEAQIVAEVNGREHHTQVARELAAHTFDLMEFLDRLRRQKKLATEFTRGFGRVAYHAPCHIRAQKVGTPGARLLGLNGAEIVFNPSATVAGLSQYLWKLEQPAHAVANGYFVAASNRVGTEAPWNIGKFYGTSYIVDPRGNFLATASEDKDELITAQCDLEQIEEVRRTWQFYRDRRPETYGDMTKL